MDGPIYGNLCDGTVQGTPGAQEFAKSLCERLKNGEAYVWDYLPRCIQQGEITRAEVLQALAEYVANDKSFPAKKEIQIGGRLLFTVAGDIGRLERELRQEAGKKKGEVNTVVSFRGYQV